MLLIKEIQSKIEVEIGKMRFDMPPDGLFDPIRYTLALGGKRIRPSLVLMACDLYSGNVEDAIPAALGLEVLHNFTLLHDDLMDQADMRRNRPTVHKKWNNNTAILSGDAMLISAYGLVANTPEPHLKRIMDLFSQTALEICCGQQFDMEFETREHVSIEAYMEMIRLKTAVLLACCLKTGAIIGGASDADADCLYRFGVDVGLAFQLQDDLLDVYGDAQTFGKNIGGDILCDKKTFLLINAINRANDEQKSQMDYFRKSAIDAEQRAQSTFAPEEKIRFYTNIYNQLGIREITQDKINRHYELAMNELAKLTVSDESLTELKTFCNKLMQREM